MKEFLKEFLNFHLEELLDFFDDPYACLKKNLREYLQDFWMNFMKESLNKYLEEFQKQKGALYNTIMISDKSYYIQFKYYILK